MPTTYYNHINTCGKESARKAVIDAFGSVASAEIQLRVQAVAKAPPGSAGATLASFVPADPCVTDHLRDHLVRTIGRLYSCTVQLCTRLGTIR